MLQNNTHYKDFCKTMDTLSRKYDRGRVFSDFLTMTVCTFHRTNIQSRYTEQDGENEALYLEVT